MLAVEMKGINKTFGPVKANQDVHFCLEQGEIHALLGENGAGKTTLMRILYGLYKADGGEIFINGQKVNYFLPKGSHCCRYWHGHTALHPGTNLNCCRKYRSGLYKRIVTLAKRN